MRDKSKVRENQLLAALPPEVLQRLLPSLENVVLPPGEILYNFEDELTHIKRRFAEEMIVTLPGRIAAGA